MSTTEVDARVQEMFEGIFGPGLGQQLSKRLHGEAPWFNEVVAKHIAPLVWQRSALDMRTKVLCAIAIFSALGKHEAGLFMRAALHHGVSQEEIHDLLFLVGLESGFPNASFGAKLLAEAVASHSADGAD